MFLVSISYGSTIDSLKQLLPETHDVERKIEIYTMLIRLYQVADLNEANKLADKALRLSQTTNTTKHLGEIYGLYGDIAIMQDSLQKAWDYYKISIEYFKEQDDLESMTGVAFVLGKIAMTQEDLPRAMQYYLQTVEYAMSGL